MSSRSRLARSARRELPKEWDLEPTLLRELMPSPSPKWLTLTWAPPRPDLKASTKEVMLTLPLASTTMESVSTPMSSPLESARSVRTESSLSQVPASTTPTEQTQSPSPRWLTSTWDHPHRDPKVSTRVVMLMSLLVSTMMESASTRMSSRSRLVRSVKKGLR